jgi:hypothetical protein
VTRRVFLVQFLKSAGAVFRGDYFIAGTLQSFVPEESVKANRLPQSINILML